MRKSPLLLITAILLLSLLLPAQNTLAAPHSQGEDQDIQIVLVLDVSGSMSTPVYTGIVPEDLLSLLLRMNELNDDPDYIDLQNQLKDAEKDEAAQEAKEAYFEALSDLHGWIEGHTGISMEGLEAVIRTTLEEAECDTRSAGLIATADTDNQIMNYLLADCPATTNKWTVLANLIEQVPYITDPDYKALRQGWQAAIRAYDQALEDSGYTSLSDQLEAYKRNTGIAELQDEIDKLVAEYGIPSRLDQAKSAAVNLIDFSALDEDRTGRESLIGLVTFSNQAQHQSGLMLNHEMLKPLIGALKPLQQTNIGDGLNLGLAELENNADTDNPMLVILLSDGHTNVGLSPSEILATIPNRANRNNIIICTAGFADLETEVDFLLLEGLAFETGGEYLFTNSGVELASFFAACREAAVGNELVDQLSGIVPAGDSQDVVQVNVSSNSCELTLAFNYLSGMPLIKMSNPEGESLDLDSEGVEYQTRNQVQLLTLTNPVPGEWSIIISNEDSREEAAVFSLVISNRPCEEGEIPADQEKSPATSIPFLFTNRGLSIMTGGAVVVIVILSGAITLLIRFRQRRADKSLYW